MARFLFSLPKKRRFQIFGRVVPRSTTPKSPVSGMKAWKITQDFFEFTQRPKGSSDIISTMEDVKNYAPFAVWKRLSISGEQHHYSSLAAPSRGVSPRFVSPELYFIPPWPPLHWAQQAPSHRELQLRSGSIVGQSTLRPTAHWSSTPRTKFHDDSLGANGFHPASPSFFGYTELRSDLPISLLPAPPGFQPLSTSPVKPRPCSTEIWRASTRSTWLYRNPLSLGQRWPAPRTPRDAVWHSQPPLFWVKLGKAASSVGQLQWPTRSFPEFDPAPPGSTQLHETPPGFNRLPSRSTERLPGPHSFRPASPPPDSIRLLLALFSSTSLHPSRSNLRPVRWAWPAPSSFTDFHQAPSGLFRLALSPRG